jgi:Holliday junction DNA helicase RuvA
MIERLVGTCVLKQAGALIVDVAGVGYGVEMTEAALAGIEEGQDLTLWVHTHVREDVLRLFGFLTHTERLVFNLLLSVSGVGPKVALGILAVVPLPQLIQAIEGDDSAVLEEVPGIGPRQSKKILLELKPKLDKLAGFGMQQRVDGKAAQTAKAGAMGSLFEGANQPLAKIMLAELKSALENFGYKDKELLVLIKRFERQPPARDLASLIRLALVELTGGMAVGPGNSRLLEELF